MAASPCPSVSQPCFPVCTELLLFVPWPTWCACHYHAVQWWQTSNCVPSSKHRTQGSGTSDLQAELADHWNMPSLPQALPQTQSWQIHIWSAKLGKQLRHSCRLAAYPPEALFALGIAEVQSGWKNPVIHHAGGFCFTRDTEQWLLYRHTTFQLRACFAWAHQFLGSLSGAMYYFIFIFILWFLSTCFHNFDFIWLQPEDRILCMIGMMSFSQKFVCIVVLFFVASNQRQAHPLMPQW